MLSSQERREKADVPGGLYFGLLHPSDVDDAARLYLQNFRERVGLLFDRETHALEFLKDFFELLRLAHGDTFLTAHDGDGLVAYLVLTMPDQNRLAAATNPRYVTRVIANGLRGRYGLPLKAARGILRTLGGVRLSETEASLRGYPHVYVIVTRNESRGRGIGTALLNQARAIAGPHYSKIWLCVDRENHSAIRLYERLGFQTVSLITGQLVMVWNIRGLQPDH